MLGNMMARLVACLSHQICTSGQDKTNNNNKNNSESKSCTEICPLEVAIAHRLCVESVKEE